MLPIAWSSRSGSASTSSRGPLDRDRPIRGLGPAREAAPDAFEDLGQVDPGEAQRQLAAHGLGDRQQVFGELGEAIGLLGGRDQRRPQFLGRAPGGERQLELGPQDRQRRPQLVAGVGDEGALVLQRLAEPFQHLVQRRPQASDLVAGRRHRQALVGLGAGDLRRPRPHRLDRVQRRGGDPVGGERGEDQRHRAAEQQQLQQVRERLVAGLGRGADDDHPPLPPVG